MIYDKIDNIEMYKGLSENLFEGMKFLKQATSDLPNGVYEINPRVKAIVSEYETKEVSENGYEAHKKYIDIQYLICGKEILRCLPIEYLSIIEKYDNSKDAAFFVEAGTAGQEMQLGNGYFAIFWPQDGHMPCLCIDKPEKVKKVVVKVEI